MSVTITQHPSAISFAGNPVLLKAYSNLSGKTFLKVCAEVSVGIYQREAVVRDGIVYHLSIPSEGGSGKPVTFDFSDVLQSALSQMAVERNAVLSGNDPSFTGGYVQYSVKVWDEFLNEYSEVTSTKDSGYVTSGRKVAIPGAYTDKQRLLLTEDTAAYLGSAHILSNKPDGEAVPLGGKVTVPVFSSSSRSVSVYANAVGSGNLLGTHPVYASEVSWRSFTPKAVGFQSLLWEGLELPPFFIHVVPEQPFSRYFEFVNRLGAVESIYTFGRAQRKNQLQQERQVKRHNVSFRPAARFIKRTLQEESLLELTTGPLSREWAKWFAEEFFTAEQVWMYSKEADDMVPVLIEADEAISVFNESEAEVPDLPFKVTFCINV